MRVTRLKLISISGSRECLDEVLEKVVELEEFYPEPARNLVNTVHGAKILDESDPYEPMLKRFEEIGKEMNLDIEDSPTFTKEEVEMMKSFMEKNHSHYEEITSIKKEIELLKQEDVELLEKMKNIDELGIKMRNLFASHYISSRLGRLPLEGEENLHFFKNQPFIWKTFQKDETYSWGIYITPKSHRKEVDNIFSSLFFERIFIPGFLEGTPEEAAANLMREVQKFEKDLDRLGKREQEVVFKTKERYSAFISVLKHHSYVFQARKYVLDFGDTFTINGFIRDYQVVSLMDDFNLLDQVEIEVRPPNGDQRLTPPKKLNHAWSLRPWGVFIERGK